MPNSERSNYSWSTAAEQPSRLKTNKNISPARLQSRLPSYWQIKLIMTAQLRSSCQVLNKSNLCPQHGYRADCQVPNISNGGACQVIYKSNLSWQDSCGTAVKFLENQTYLESHLSSSKPIKLSSTARLRSSPRSYKQIKHVSPARLQSRLQSSRQIKLILTAPSFKQIKFISTARLQGQTVKFQTSAMEGPVKLFTNQTYSGSTAAELCTLLWSRAGEIFYLFLTWGAAPQQCFMNNLIYSESGMQLQSYAAGIVQVV